MTVTNSNQNQAQKQGLPEEILIEEALREKRVRDGVPYQLRQRKSDKEIAEYLGFPPDCVDRLIRRVLLGTRTFDCKSKGKLTDKDLEWVGWMRDYNISYKTIAEVAQFDELEIEVTARSGSNHYRPLQPSEGELTPEERKAIEDLFFLNKSAGEVAKQIGRTEPEVAEAFKEIIVNYRGNHSKYKKLSYDDLKVFEYGRKHGFSQNRLAEIIGCSSGALTKLVKNYSKDTQKDFNAQDAYLLRLGKKNQRKNTHYKEEDTEDFRKELKKAVESGSASVKGFCSRKVVDEAGFDKKRALSYQTIYNRLNDGSFELSNFKPKKNERKTEEKKADEKPKKNTRRVGRPYEELPEKQYKNGLPLEVYVEMDTVMGKLYDSQNLLTLHVEGSRIGVIQLLVNKTASCVNEALLNVLPVLDAISPNGIKYVLTDNGKEFTKCKEIDSIAEKLFCAHPQTPTEKPHVENYNRNIRPFYEKGETMDNTTKDEVKEAERKIALKPVASLFWLCPWEALQVDIRYFYGEDTEGAEKAIAKVAEYYGF